MILPRTRAPALSVPNIGGATWTFAEQNMPFARPPLDEILMAIDFVVKNDYPARDEMAA